MENVNGFIAAITGLISAVLGAGLGSIVTAIIGKKKTDAEANSTNVQTILEVDARLNERLAKLEERVANLEGENIQLRRENLYLRTKLGIKPDEDLDGNTVNPES